MTILLASAIFYCLVVSVKTLSYSQSTRSTLRMPVKMHFEESLVGNTALAPQSLPRVYYLASNRFNCREQAMAKFEKRWAERKSRLALLPGFRFFSLFRRIELDTISTSQNIADKFNYISFTLWNTKSDFDSWRTGEAFKEAHGGGGITDFMQLIGTALFILNGSPKPAFYDSLLVRSGESISSFASDEGWRQVVADGQNLLPGELILIQDKYSVKKNQEVAFEQIWHQATDISAENARTRLGGFVGFTLLRRDADKADDGYNYIVSTLWRSQSDVIAWRGSPGGSWLSKTPVSADLLTQPCVTVAYEGKLTLVSPSGLGGDQLLAYTTAGEKDVAVSA